jgi:hypothetical protein
MVFLGGAALMLWFRDQGWHWAGALIAALAFGYGASMAWRIQHIGQVLSLTYVPITLLCLDRALQRKSIVYGAAAGVAAALIVVGRDQVALLSLYFLAGFAAWRILATDTPLQTARANLLPLTAGAASALLVFTVPLLLTFLFASESNRPEIDYIGAGRGSLHPALLLTLVAPDAFGASGRMADYWGPPSFAWSGTGLFIAQNVGELYIGAIPLLLILLASLRGDLWARDIRFFTIAALLMLFYALGWYTPAFQVFYTLLPGISLYRRPADATFLVGALGAILAGYAAHRLFTDKKAEVSRQHALIAGGMIAGAVLLLILLAVWLDRLPRLPYPLGISVLTFAVAGLVLYWVRMGIAVQPTLAAILLVAFATLDLAYHNGQTGRPHCRHPPTTCSSRPPTTPPSPSSSPRSSTTASGATASNWPASASTGRTRA